MDVVAPYVGTPESGDLVRTKEDGPCCARCGPVCGEPGEHVTRRARHLYECEGWSTRRIAAACGINRARLTNLLRAAGVRLVPRGAGRARPSRIDEPANLAGVLRHLYLHQRLSSTRIAELLGMSDRLVRSRLAQFGIDRRTKGRCNREDRARLGHERLYDLAVLQDLSATEISETTDTGYLPVLRQLHGAGVPVRLGGNPPRSGPARIEVLAALYADAKVRTALDAHGIPVVPPGGQLWERFPVPAPLSADLLSRLYVDCGLSTSHIELLTGQPAATVRHHLMRHGIPRRPPGGRSPFLRRWRASLSSGSAVAGQLIAVTTASRATSAISM